MTCKDPHSPAVTAPSSFLYAVDNGKVPAGTVYVIFDVESWSLTTHSEQVNPGKYMEEFVVTAHQHGYKAILAPSLDLTTITPCGKSSSPWVNYLTDCALPTLVANDHPDVYAIQSQSDENDTTAGSNCACYQ